MRSEEEIKTILKRYEGRLALLKQNEQDNQDQRLEMLYRNQINRTEGIIKGLNLALGTKIKLKLKDR